MMTIYASIDNIAPTPVDSHAITNKGDFHAFSRSFSATKPLGNMINVGPSVDAADNKVRAELKQWHLDNPFCRLILLGLSTDKHYARTLEFLKTTDSPNLHKIVLITGPPLPSDITDLGFRHETMKVFNTQKLGLTYRTSPVAAVRPNRDSRWCVASESLDADAWTSKTAAKKSGMKGRPSEEAFAYVRALKPGPCNDHYLIGECNREGCPFRHNYLLSEEQVAAIRTLVMERCGKCRYGKECRNKEKCLRIHPESEDEDGSEKGGEREGEDEYNPGDYTWETTTKRGSGGKKEEGEEQEEEIPNWMRSTVSDGPSLLESQKTEDRRKKW